MIEDEVDNLKAETKAYRETQSLLSHSYASSSSPKHHYPRWSIPSSSSSPRQDLSLQRLPFLAEQPPVSVASPLARGRVLLSIASDAHLRHRHGSPWQRIAKKYMDE